MRSVVDKAVGKIVSRKFTVFTLSTLFLFLERLSGDQWVAVSLAYIGLQGAADIATQWKHGNKL